MFIKLSFGLMIAVAAASLPSHAQAQSGCVATPADYAAAFNSCQPVSCVAPNLYGVIGSGTPSQQTSVYPSDFYWGWVDGAEGLQQYADWQLQSCHGTLPKSEVTRRILLWVGFGESDITKGTPYTLSVMDLGHDESLLVPSFEAWFLAFERAFDLVIPLDAQKILHWSCRTIPGREPLQLRAGSGFQPSLSAGRRNAREAFHRARIRPDQRVAQKTRCGSHRATPP